MHLDKKIALLDELVGLRKAQSACLDEDVTYSKVRRYTDPARFQSEITHLFRTHPMIAARSTELANYGDYLVRETAGQEVLLTLYREGGANNRLTFGRYAGALDAFIQIIDDTIGPGAEPHRWHA